KAHLTEFLAPKMIYVSAIIGTKNNLSICKIHFFSVVFEYPWFFLF
ncbi:MAG: hypothetical protein ACI8WB_003798, partial [Phenylobacterium sp.]